MKKRASTGPHARLPSPLEADTSKRGGAQEGRHRPGDDPGPIVVPAAEFDALLALIDEPPAISDDLRREIAGRRWA